MKTINKPVLTLLLTTFVFESSCLFSTKSTLTETSAGTSEHRSKEINFWTPRLIEHTHYMDIAFKWRKSIKAQSQLLRNELKSFEGKESYNDQSVNQFIELLKKMKALQKKAKSYIGKNRALKALLGHMDEELERLNSSVSGVVSSATSQEAFRSRHSKEVQALEHYTIAGTAEEKALVSELVKHGIKDHETKEDTFLRSLIQRKELTSLPKRRLGRSSTATKSA